MTCTESLQPVEGHDNIYNIRAREPVYLRSCKANPITLTTQDPSISLPNRDYLAIHAACYRVAHLSGAADYLEDTFDSDDKGNNKVLSEWVEVLILFPAISYYTMYLLFLKPVLFGLIPGSTRFENVL